MSAPRSSPTRYPGARVSLSAAGARLAPWMKREADSEFERLLWRQYGLLDQPITVELSVTAEAFFGVRFTASFSASRRWTKVERGPTFLGRRRVRSGFVEQPIALIGAVAVFRSEDAVLEILPG